MTTATTTATISKTLANQIAAVRKHAKAHYNEGGWDYVVEAMADEDLAEIISEAGAKSHKAAIAAVGESVGAKAEARADARAAGGLDDEEPATTEPEAPADADRTRVTTADAFGVLDALFTGEAEARSYLDALPVAVRHKAIKKAMSKTMAKGAMHLQLSALLTEYPPVAGTGPRRSSSTNIRKIRKTGGVFFDIPNLANGWAVADEVVSIVVVERTDGRLVLEVTKADS